MKSAPASTIEKERMMAPGPSGPSATSGEGWGWSRADRKHLFIWVLVGFAAPAPLMFAMEKTLRPSGPTITVQSEFMTKAIAAFFVLLATWIVSRLERRPLGDYGIPPRRAFGMRFWEGTVWGFAMLSAVLLVIHLLSHYRIDSVAVHGRIAAAYGAGWALVFLAVAIGEEFAFRGYWLFLMSKSLRFWPSAVILSGVFVLAHVTNRGETALGLLQVFAAGLLFCFTVRRTGNLWFAVGFHAAWDWAQTFFYGTADSGLVGAGRLLNSRLQGPNWLSGGSVGPEGSVAAVFVLLFCAMLVHFRFPRVNYADRPLRSSFDDHGGVA